MTRQRPTISIPWLGAADAFPPVELALDNESGHAGLLAAGADLSPDRLLDAYAHGIYPWYSPSQPILWWSPDPRMVLYLDEFRVGRSFLKTLKAAAHNSVWKFRFDTRFDDVVLACAQVDRHGQTGTWITDEMRGAYAELHRLGHAHSFEAWHRGELVGGGYGVSIGRMFYGESMFAFESNASKFALAALVKCLREREFRVIDCQQNTRHLASLGAREIPRGQFASEIAQLIACGPGEDWPRELQLPIE